MKHFSKPLETRLKCSCLVGHKTHNLSLSHSLTHSLTHSTGQGRWLLYFLPTVADSLLMAEMLGRCKYTNQGIWSRPAQSGKCHEMTFVVKSGVGSQVISFFGGTDGWCHRAVAGSVRKMLIQYIKKKKKQNDNWIIWDTLCFEH